MCGRFTLRARPADVARLFDVSDLPEFSPRYNVSPSQPVAVIRNRPHHPRRKESGSRREFVFLRWGLLPSWAGEDALSQNMINARSETVSEKPAFRAAFRYRRCLVPADGFYEWQVQGKAKQPYFIHRPDDQVFAIAGMWESWEGPAGVLETCAILTTTANAALNPIHHRMPVLLPRETHALWLDPEVQSLELLQPLLVPRPPDELSAQPVSSVVNHARHDAPDCLDPPKKSPRTLFD